MKTSAIVGYVFAGLFGVVILGALGSMTNLITIPWLKFSRQINTERGILEKIYNADNALAQYHWFKERAEAIEATKIKIKNAEAGVEIFEQLSGSRITWTFEDKNEHARLTAVALGLNNHYQDLIAEYNARAKETDRAIFKDELPLFFSLEPF